LSLDLVYVEGLDDMVKNNGTCKELYGVSRIDCDRQNAHAWRVSLRRYGKRYVRNFTDKRYQCRELALAKAVEYRDQFLLENPPISRKDFCSIKRRNNKTGITGVYKYRKTYELKDGTIKESWYWEANWPDLAGVSISESFAINRFGEVLAKKMAIEARENGMRKVVGTFWAAERGDVTPLDAR
jgi:hypothetical protein